LFLSFNKKSELTLIKMEEFRTWGKSSNIAINTDRKKRRSFVALLFASGYGQSSTPMKVGMPYPAWEEAL